MDHSKGAGRKIRRRCLGIAVGTGALLALTAPPPTFGAGPQANTVPPLLGTAVEEGKDSSALFGAGETFVWVNEGDEIATGLRLIRVYSDHATVKQEGTGQEIQVDLGSGGSFDGRVPPPRPLPAAAPPRAAPTRYRPSQLQSMTPQQLDQLNQQIKARFERARSSQEEGGSQRGNTQEEDPEEE